ncbi:MAG: CBS domain-containing protein [Desulfobacteraceae bacterium]|nr:CBS domain-containing protein [Desulfobacteraceae bacterium]
MTVGEFCNREVVIATRDDVIVEIAKLMRQHHVGDVVIVDQAKLPPVPVGIVTDRDIVVELVAEEVALESVKAGDIMSYELVTAREEDGIWETLQRMRAQGVRRVPVVNRDGGLEGILTVDDLLELFSEELLALAKVPAGEVFHEKKLRE